MIAAERLDVGVEVDLALVDVEAVLLFNLLRNLLCGDGAEQSAALARLCSDADGLVLQSFRNALRFFGLGFHFICLGGLGVFQLVHHLCVRFLCKLARQQEIACVAFCCIDELAFFAYAFYIC